MYFIDRTKPRFQKIMNNFYRLPEFEKELKKLSKRYPSLPSDIEDIKPILLVNPTGIGKNFTIVSIQDDVKIIKVRIHCESLRSRAVRLIYAFHENKIEFMYIEMYFKGDKTSEDKERILNYLQNFK